MSETPNNNNENLFELTASQDVSHPAEETGIEPEATGQPEAEQTDWVTVNFPDAIAVDQIPHEPEPAQTSVRIQELEQQNHHLQARVSELEAALVNSQTLLRTETDRLEKIAGAQFAAAEERAQRDAQISQQQAAMIAKQRQALDAAKQRLQDQEDLLEQRSHALNEAQTQIKQLAQDLDLGHQTNQKQQIVVETLTTQLQASQEQVAQLERECALIKQQSDEQTQLTRQAENTCKDLRSRLNRQQQYTLQFKAALEKCLDVPAAQVSMAAETAQRAIDEEELCSASPTAFIKAQPVQPWSAMSGVSGFVPDSDGEPWVAEPAISASLNSEETIEGLEVEGLEESLELEPITESFSLEPVSESFPEFSALENSIDEFIEPEPSVKPLSYTIQRPEVESSLEDSNEAKRIQLFFPSGEPEVQFEFPPATIVQTEESFVAESAIAPTVLPEEPIADLEAPIQEESITIELSQNPWSNAFETEAEVFEVTEEAALPPVESAVPESEFIAPSSSPFITLTPSAARSTVLVAEASDNSDADTSPSPIVYPERSQKKLPSLAAVDLPSFPRPVKQS